MRVQFTTPVATHCDQGDTAVVAPVELVPGLLQDIVDEPGAGFDQRADFVATTKTLVEHLAGLADGFLEGGDGARLEASSAWNWPRSNSSGSTWGIASRSCRRVACLGAVRPRCAGWCRPCAG